MSFSEDWLINGLSSEEKQWKGGTMEKWILQAKRRRINRAKLHLYHFFLKIPHEELSDSEVEIMYLLSKEKNIQEILKEKANETL